MRLVYSIVEKQRTGPWSSIYEVQEIFQSGASSPRERGSLWHKVDACVRKLCLLEAGWVSYYYYPSRAGRACLKNYRLVSMGLWLEDLELQQQERHILISPRGIKLLAWPTRARNRRDTSELQAVQPEIRPASSNVLDHDVTPCENVSSKLK